MRYKDYVPLFTQGEGEHIKRQCTSCQKFIPSGRLAHHVETEHANAESTGLIIQVNDIWWGKRGY